MLRVSLFPWVFLAVAPAAFSQDALFSGPQVGEAMVPFQITQAIGPQDGQSFDPVAAANGGPILIVFVHEVTRPSIGLTRAVVNYAHRFESHGLHSSVVLLDDDPTEAKLFVRRASHALPKLVPIGISPDGLEGPGAYGLNRKVSLTILVGKSARVTANFALVQPSLAADAPKIGAAIQSVLGNDHTPDLAEMGIKADRGMARMDDGAFRRLLTPVINRNATPDQVAEAAAAVEAAAAENAAIRQRLGQVTRRIVDAGVLQNYGTPAAQERIRHWAEKYGAETPQIEAFPKQDSGPTDSPQRP